MEQGEAIPVEECWRLLGTADVGRLALSVDALPAVLPVSYAMDGREVAMCLGELRVPERAAHGAIVALEVDELGAGDRAGWFVHAVGMARLAPGPSGGAPGDDGPPGWLVARLAPTIVYGRRIHLHPPPAGG
jgi:nitroimidazol reductase NimA-like FMN-containing flavoprotein (pyridoxamine 5'-phosphate oxidase superfamily)